MNDLLRALVLCGLLSGTQPITLMGALLVMAGARPRANGLAFVAAAFLVETLIVVFASVLLGGRVDPHSSDGHTFIGARIVLGLALVGFGLAWRRPPPRPQAETPKALRRLRDLSPAKSFVAGLVVADYQGPAIASLALATATPSPTLRLVAIVPYTLLATGIPLTIVLVSTRSERAYKRLSAGTDWVLRNRRPLGSWFALGFGLVIFGDALLTLLRNGS